MSTFPFPDITPNEVSWTLVSNTGVFRSPLTGSVQTNDRTGERWMARLTFRNLKDAESRRLQSFLASLNGQQHRFTFFDPSYVKAGSVTATEMLDVAFNATNWRASPAGGDRGSITGIDAGVRFKVGTQTDAVILHPTTSADGISAPTAALSYAATISALDSRAGPDGAVAPPAAMTLRDSNWGNLLHPDPAAVTTGQRHVAAATAPSASTLHPRPSMNWQNSGEFGATVDVRDLSVARAFLVDNGFNALTYSEDFDNAAWTKTRTTITSNPSPGANAPDGSDTADELVEDSTASSTHFALQSYTRASVAEYWTGSVYVKPNTSQRILLIIDDGGAGSNYGQAHFDASTGAITGAAATGGSASNAYASIHDAGGGWYRCRVSVRLTSTTAARLIIYLCDGASNTVTFNGDGTSGLYTWGAQLQRGGQLGRYTPTTTTATTGTSQTGKQIWLKGLDASTNGQLLPGDQMEINGQLVRLTSQLDGDAEGIGLAEVSPRIRNAPDDEAAAILYRPHGKFLLADPQASWTSRPGIFSDFSFDIIEDIA